MAGSKRLSWNKRTWRWLGLTVLVTFACFIAVPTGRYLLRAGFEEARILARRQPISALVSRPSTPRVLREKLTLVLAARAYAGDSLGLTTGQSFATYSELDRDTLVLILSGAYRDKLTAYTWWFPIVGRVPYKGYFDFGEARRQEQALSNRGFDARLGAVSAFSTLGWFNDPLLPGTLHTDSIHLANTVIHELTHSTYYAAGSAIFNESFANFVGARGAEQFFRARGQSAAADEAVARWTDEMLLGRFWADLYNRVDSTFKSHPGDEPAVTADRIALRDSIFSAARRHLINDIGPQLRTVSPRALERVRFDNATLMARRVYLTDLDAFDALLSRCDGDLKRTIQVTIAAARKDRKNPFAAVDALVDALRRARPAPDAR